ncbi:hypothetical protein T265_15111, partial [Opisthorchis viverrini]
RFGFKWNIRLTETRGLRLPDEPQEWRHWSWAVEQFSATLKLLTRLLKTPRQPTAGFALLEAHQIGAVSEFPSTLCSACSLVTAAIPYKTGTSEVIHRLLNLVNIRVAFQKGKTLRSVLIPCRLKGLETCIKCNHCAKVHIGQTASELHTRIGEHKRRINKPPRNAEEYQTLVTDSAMAVHSLDTGHRINLENVEVLRRGLRFTPQRFTSQLRFGFKWNIRLTETRGLRLPDEPKTEGRNRSWAVEGFSETLIGHVIGKLEAFNVMYRVLLDRLRLIRSRYFAIVEIRLHDPQLCAKKKFMLLLNLSLGNLKVSQPSSKLRVAWHLGIKRVLQRKDAEDTTLRHHSRRHLQCAVGCEQINSQLIFSNYNKLYQIVEHRKLLPVWVQSELEVDEDSWTACT